MPIYFEIAAQIMAQKPTAGWKANAYVIFDYFSPTDFKFAGIDVSLNKLVMGHRDATGWHVDAQAPVPARSRPTRGTTLLVAVNGTTVTVAVNGQQAFTYTFAPRILDGEPVGLNKGFVGAGSDNARGVLGQLRRPGAAAAADARLADELHRRRRRRSAATRAARGRSAAGATRRPRPPGSTSRVAPPISASTACDTNSCVEITATLSHDAASAASSFDRLRREPLQVRRARRRRRSGC